MKKYQNQVPFQHDGLDEEDKAGFYGLDVFSLYDSLQEVLRYLERNDGSALEAARKAFRCFEPYYEDPRQYARATQQLTPEGDPRNAPPNQRPPANL